MDDIKEQLLNELHSKNFRPEGLTLDGSIKRFDRDGHDNAWYIGYEGVTRSGKKFGVIIFGDWKEGQKWKFKTDFNYSEAEKVEINQFASKKTIEVNLKTSLERKEATEAAKKYWKSALLVGTHPYLVKKKISSLFGARIATGSKGQVLVLPMRNVFGDLKGVQKIFENGDKRYIKGQENRGHFVIIPDGYELNGKQEIYIAEGFATGASIHMATNKPVVCALSANNMSAVCWALKRKNPQLIVTIAGDNDRKTPGNPGKTKATEAAEQIGATIVFPDLRDPELIFSDFNDIHTWFGIEELIKQLKNVEKTKAKPPPPTILASQFIEEQKMTLDENRLVAWRTEFYQFTNRCYEKLVESDLLNDVVKFTQLHPLAWVKAGKSFGKEILSNIEAKVNAKTSKSIPFWISDPTLEIGDVISVNNGIVDLSQTGKIGEIQLLPHNSDLFQTVSLPFDFDVGSECPIWQIFLNEMVPDKETQLSLQEWFGYNLVFDNSFQKFAIFHGQGANGKTVCCVVLRALLGVKNVSGVNLEAFDPKRTFNLAATVGKLANIVEELSVNSKAEEGELKKFVSGGLMTVERKHKDPFEIIPTARLTFATNTLPKMNDSSDGIWRRVLLYPFNNQILNPAKQNRDLVDPKFWAESRELSGIFNWALIGLFRLRANKAFTESAEMRLALDEFKIETNPTRDFLTNYCEIKKGAVLSSAHLYFTYKGYMEKCGYHPLAINRFTNEVKLAFPGLGKSKNAISHGGERTHVWYDLDLPVVVHK